MIRSIEILREPLVILGSSVLVFYTFSWLLEKLADFLGIDEDLD